MTTKRNIENRLDRLESESDEEDELTEWVSGVTPRSAPVPELTEAFADRGFVVERERWVCDNGNRDIQLHVTPDPDDILLSALWHHEGPTAPADAVRIQWEAEKRVEVVEGCESEVVYEEPDLPSDPAILGSGDGWTALAPADLVVENMIVKRSTAERSGYEQIGPVPGDIKDAEKYDLVEVDAEPLVYSKRREIGMKDDGEG